MIYTHQNKKRIIIAALFLALVCLFVSCKGNVDVPTSTPTSALPSASPTPTAASPETSFQPGTPDTMQTPVTTVTTPDSTPSETPGFSETPPPSETAEPTPSETPPFTDDTDYIGPVVIGEGEYYVIFKDGMIILADTESKEAVYTLPEQKPSDIELFLSTLSLIDLNFDEQPDLSFRVDESGKRICYISQLIKNPDDPEDEGIIVLAKDIKLSNLIFLTKNARNGTLFAKKADSDSHFTSFTFVDGVLTEGEVINETFEWTPEKIAEALFGEGTPIEEGPEYTIRGTAAESRTILGAITVAFDQYGNYYIKDTPSSPFCRLMLNPNGSWSKSEKVG